jgi:hypothetical protein
MNIQELFYNPKFGFRNAYTIYKKLKEKDKNIKYKDVKEFVDKQLTNQVNTQRKKPKEYNSIFAPYPRFGYQIDIMNYDRYEYNNYKYIFVCIDVHSRYLFCRALTNRRMSTILKVMNEIFDKMGIPVNINCDNEFNKTEFNKLMDDKGVRMWYSQPDEINKNSIVERVNRTIALILQKYRIGLKKYDWYKVLPDIVENYNNTEHRTIKAKPIDVWNGIGTNKQEIKYNESSIKVGDTVRIKNKKKVFSKGDELSYSKDIYTVVEQVRNKFKVKNKNGQELKTLYKDYELKKVDEVQTYEEDDDEEDDDEDDEEKKYDNAKEEKRINRRLKQVGIDQNNLVQSKRRIKPKQIVDL